MNTVPAWVPSRVVEAIHLQLLAEFGGAAGIRNGGLLESALARPQQLFACGGSEVGLPQLAAAYAFGLARNHPFVDGNKRSALVIALLFLRLNGADISATPDDRYLTFMALADGSLSEDELARWFDRHLVST